MRFFELLLTLLLALALLWAVVRPPARLVLFVFPLLLVLALHLLREGVRWQLVPAYALVLLLVLAALGQLLAPASSGGGRAWRIAGGVGLAALGVGSALAWLLPVPPLPAPGGPYPVGTVSYHLVDPAREERYTDAPGDAREIVVQLWYPAAPQVGARPAPWLSDPEPFIAAVARLFRLPRFALSHLALVRSHSYPHAPLAAEPAPFPVVVAAHGWTGFRAVHANQLEALASHGYVAVAIDHSYGALVTVFPDGRVAPNNPAALPDSDSVPPEVYDRASQQLVATYAGDVRFVLDQLERLNAGEPIGQAPPPAAPHLAGRLDLARVGLFGHSTGGGAIVLACSQDARCRAGLGMDAWVEPVPDEAIQRGLAQPFLFMRSEPWTRNPNDARLARLYAASTGERYRLGIAGTLHRDFTLQGLLSPLLPALGLSGTLERARTLDIVSDYLLAFFDQTLRGLPAPLLDGPSPRHPEVQFERAGERAGRRQEQR